MLHPEGERERIKQAAAVAAAAVAAAAAAAAAAFLDCFDIRQVAPPAHSLKRG